MKRAFYFLLCGLVLTKVVISQNIYYDAKLYASLTETELSNIADYDENAAKVGGESLLNFNGFSDEAKNAIKALIQFKKDPFAKDYELKHALIRKTISKYNSIEEAKQTLLLGISDDLESGFINSLGLGATFDLVSGLVLDKSTLNDTVQSNLIDGLSKYYAEEFRKAQTQSYLKVFEKSIGQIGELEIIFPKTYSKLRLTEPHRLPDLGEEFKTVFHDDLSNSWTNLINEVRTRDVQNQAAESKMKLLTNANIGKIRDQEYYLALLIINDFLELIDSGMNPILAYESIDVKYKDRYEVGGRMLTTQDRSIMDAIHGVNLIQKSLRDTATVNDTTQIGELWIDLSDISKLDGNELKIYTGLIYQQDVEFFNKLVNGYKSAKLLKSMVISANPADKDRVNKLFKASITVLGNYEIKISFDSEDASFDDLVSKIEKEAKVNFKNAEKVKLKKTFKEISSLNVLYEQLSYYVQKGARYMNELQVNYKNVKSDSVTQQLYFDYTKSAFDFIFDFQLIETSGFDKKLIGSTIENLARVYNSFKVKDYENAFLYSFKTLSPWIETDLDKLDIRAFTKINSYVEFASKSLKAETSDEVKNVIRKYAAPPASYSIKRSYRNTFSITGQPGYFLSLEQLDNSSDWNFVSGITLPMGIEYTRRINAASNNDPGASFGVFFQLIDIGAVMNFRVGDASSTLPDQINFEQVVSPGISFNYGLPTSPINISIGYQRTPELREVTKDGSTFFDKGHRFFLRFVWDIPFLNLGKWN